MAPGHSEIGHTGPGSRYYLPSWAFPPERFNAIVREHWSIESRMHWVLDVMINEDRSRNTKDNCPDNLALLRKLTPNLPRSELSNRSIRGKLKRAGWDNNYLAIILSQFTQIQMR